jgi:hypothetical protein
MLSPDLVAACCLGSDQVNYFEFQKNSPKWPPQNTLYADFRRQKQAIEGQRGKGTANPASVCLHSPSPRLRSVAGKSRTLLPGHHIPGEILPCLRPCQNKRAAFPFCGKTAPEITPSLAPLRNSHECSLSYLFRRRSSTEKSRRISA